MFLYLTNKLRMYDNSDDISTPDSGESARTPMGVLKVIWDTLAESARKRQSEAFAMPDWPRPNLDRSSG